MSAPTPASGVAAMSAGRLALLFAALAGTNGLAAAQLMTGEVHLLVLLTTMLIGFVAAFTPQTFVTGVFVIWAIGSWAVFTDGGWSVELLLAALSVVVVHLSTALAAGVPPRAEIPRPLFTRYGLRLLVIAGLTVVVWSLYWLIERVDLPSGPWPSLIALLLVLAVLLVVLLRVLARDDVEQELTTPPAGGRSPYPSARSYLP